MATGARVVRALIFGRTTMATLGITIHVPIEIEPAVRRLCRTAVHKQIAHYLKRSGAKHELTVEAQPKEGGKNYIIAVLELPYMPNWEDIPDIVGSVLSHLMNGEFNVEVRDARSEQTLPYTRIDLKAA